MKVFLIWLIFSILLFGYGISTKYELLLDGKQLTLTRLDYWGYNRNILYRGSGIGRFEYGEGPFPVMIKGKKRYSLMLYDSNGVIIPIPSALGHVYGTTKVKKLTSAIKAGVERGNLKMTGYAHKMYIALGVFPALLACLYFLDYLHNSRQAKP